MERKLVYLLLLLLALINTSVYADFFYNPIAPKPEELLERDLKCIPGRTVIKISDIKNLTIHETEEETEFRRSHMNHGARDESCEICVCSLEGKDEYCSKRPARNVNECIRMAKLKTDMVKNLPYSHDRALAYRIRRGGDTLCCHHPDGHRRSMHAQVRNKIRQMRRKVPKENILASKPLGDYVDFIVNND